MIVNEKLIFSIQQYILISNSKIEKISKQLYNHPTKSTWEMFDELMQHLTYLNESITAANKNMQELSNKDSMWADVLDAYMKVNEILLETEKAIVAKDYILIGDLLTYEITPILESVYNQINTITEKKVN